MKRLIIIALAIVCGVALSDSFAKKPKRGEMTKEEAEAKLDSLRKEQARKETLMGELDRYDKGKGPWPNLKPMEFYMPCMEESYDTEEEFRGLGIAEGENEEQAREKARHEAFNQILNKMPCRITSVTTSSKTKTHTETTIVYDITEEQKQSLYDNSEIICLKFERMQDGRCRAYVALRTLRK